MVPQFDDPFTRQLPSFEPEVAHHAGVRPTVPWWVWIFVAICAGIPIVALGGVVPVVIATCGASACVAAARKLRSTPAVGVIACFGITVTCWLAFGGMIVAMFVLRGGRPADLVRPFVQQPAVPPPDLPRPQFPQRAQPHVPAAPQPSLTTLSAQGQIDPLRQRLAVGADPNAADQGRLPLAAAVGARQFAIAELLLSAGADPNRPPGNSAPLSLAVQSSDVAMLRLLLSHNAKIDAARLHGRSLLRAALDRNLTDVAIVLAENGAHLDDTLPVHLMVAVRSGNDALLTAVLESQYQFSANDVTAVDQAIRTGAVHTIEVMLNHGMPVDLQTSSGQPLLHLALLADKLAIAQCLLEHGADPNQPNQAGEPPLVSATRARSIIGTSLLLKHKARVDELDRAGRSPLHYAVTLDAPQISGLLFKYGGDINLRDRGGNTPIMLAISRANHAMLRMFLKDTTELTYSDATGRTLLHHAIDRSDLPTVKLLVEKGAPLSVADRNGVTPLARALSEDLGVAEFLAAQGAQFTADGSTIPRPRQARLRTDFLTAAESGHVALVSALLDAGLPVDIADSRLREQAIHRAAAAGQLPMVKLLLARGAACDATDTRYETPLFLALREQHEDVAKTLMDAGADPLRRLPNNGTLLHLAARIDRPALVSRLLELKSDVDVRDGIGRTPLLWAADSDATSACAVLITAGANINVKESSGASVLEVAVRRGNAPLARLLMKKGIDGKDNRLLFQAILNWRGDEQLFRELLDYGASIETPNGSGEPPLCYACRRKRRDAARILIASGAQPNEVDARGRTALHWAAVQKDSETIKLLLDAGADVNLKDVAGATAYDLAQTAGLAMPADLAKRLKPPAK